ncbi:MAG: signal peptide peptidase SppA [Muribaculaceae bacterium]|nr:signal peptide peptidase SppA [Muribaculaceae bacterium]
MLKKFFMNLLSSFVGAWIALVLFGVVAVIVCVGVAARMGDSSETPSVKKHSVMVLDLKGVIEEAEAGSDMDFSDIVMSGGKIDRPLVLSELVSGIREGKNDKSVEALYIKCEGVRAGVSTLRSLREEIESFRKSGKRVYAYSDSYSQADYYVATAADSIFLNAAGAVDIRGIGGTVEYLKGLFDKIGVTFQVFKVGTFKSAVEPYIMTQMSEPARMQLDTLYGNIWKEIRTAMAQSRKMKEGEINRMASEEFTVMRDASWALGHKLVDRVVYQRQMDDIIGKIVDKEGKDVNFVDVATMAARASWGRDYTSKKQIAVLYASGEIAESERAGIYCEKLVPEIVKLADDDNIKGLVMRVNSPGGSVFGSEQIAEALAYFKSKKKPFAVSMGDYAASGGYWISADADRIFASPLTITGSIGIFGLVPNVGNLLGKIGVSPQGVYTNPEADFPNPYHDMTPAQSEAMQRGIEEGYDKFIARVAKGRKMKEARVRQIAEGRVWDGSTALRLGLVDQLGSLQDAIDWVAGKCDMKGNHGVACYPQYEPGFWDLLSGSLNTELGEVMAQYGVDRPEAVLIRYALDIVGREPVQARMIPVRVRL